MKSRPGILVIVFLVVLGCQSVFGTAQDRAKPDIGKVLGTWNLEIYADGQSIYLTLVLVQTDGALSGKMSEQMGMFTDAPLKNIKYEGTALAFEITVPSPPDGLERTWQSRLTVSDDTVEGSISNAEVGISVPIIGKRDRR